MEDNKQTTKRRSKLEKRFQKYADRIDKMVGSPYWFFFSVFLVLVWLPSGILFGFNEIWHLIINTTTTILTFLMISLLHSSQQKWEDKMEKLQAKGVFEVRELKKETEKISGGMSQKE